ncbi:galactokinase [Pseudonocardia spinosispora]|uniref:galactokinase n=1 Tax=Pseudonocardia spinosispora TaxID=103441 RepID=UPI0003F55D9E|nr:galactokinase [Pseudonocardia spinosispora]
MTRAHWYPPPSRQTEQRCIELFESTYGGAPDGVWSAPGRVNLIGEHVDYVGGICVPFALGERTWAAVRSRTDGILQVASGQLNAPWYGHIDHIAPGRPDGWAAYPAGVVWAMRQEGLLPAEFGGADVAVYSEVPLGAGLSSSAALECALAVALADLHGGGSGEPGSERRSALVKACMRAENEIALAMTGGLDQAVALHARAGYCLRLDCDSEEMQQVPLPLERHHLEILVINTNAPHQLVDGQYAQRRASVDRAAQLLGMRTLRQAFSVEVTLARLVELGEDSPELLRRVRHAISETARAGTAARLLAEDRLLELGPLLNASHASLRDDYEISCVELDTAVDASLEAGALGARLVGGGFGGSAIALVHDTDVEKVAEAVASAAAARELAEPSFLLAEVSAAAG